MSIRALIIFIKNPQLGKVKTRLANEIGEELALKTYFHLLEHTRSTTENLNVDKFLYYSEAIDENDLWDSQVYFKRVQIGKDIGERMGNAISEQLKQYQQVVLIGSDNLEITAEIIETSFQSLDKNDVSIGPAKDGGYYLIGMKNFSKSIFEGIKWSSSSVYAVTLNIIDELGLNTSILPILSDIDYLEDLNNSPLKKIIF